jgi:hypothetical protein
LKAQLLHKEGLNVASDLVHQDGVDRTVSPLGMLANPVPHFGPKTFPIRHEVIGGLDVERIVKVEQIVEERVEAPDNVPKSSSGCPTHTVHYTNREKTFQTLCSIYKKNFRRICSVSCDPTQPLGTDAPHKKDSSMITGTGTPEKCDHHAGKKLIQRTFL